MLEQENKDLTRYSKILSKLLLYLDKHKVYLDQYSLVKPYKLAKKLAYKYDRTSMLPCTFTGNSISTPDWGSGDWVNVNGKYSTLPFGIVTVVPKEMAAFTNRKRIIKSFGDVKFSLKHNMQGDYVSMDIGACYPNDDNIVLQFIGYIHVLQNVIKYRIKLNCKRIKQESKEQKKKHIIDTKYSWHNIFKNVL